MAYFLAVLAAVLSLTPFVVANCEVEIRNAGNAVVAQACISAYTVTGIWDPWDKKRWFVRTTADCGVSLENQAFPTTDWQVLHTGSC